VSYGAVVEKNNRARSQQETRSKKEKTEKEEEGRQKATA